jgi:hypothetical protein
MIDAFGTVTLKGASIPARRRAGTRRPGLLEMNYG